MYIICVRKKVSCSRSKTEDFPIPPGFPAKTITFSWLPGAIWRFPEKNRGTPKSSNLNRIVHEINHPAMGVSPFMETLGFSHRKKTSVSQEISKIFS